MTGGVLRLLSARDKEQAWRAMFEPKAFWKHMYCSLLKKVFGTLLGLFGGPHSYSGPGELCPSFPPRYAADHNTCA